MGLDQSSKLHHPTVHGLGCRTTFMESKIKENKNLNDYNRVPSTLVLGTAYARAGGPPHCGCGFLRLFCASCRDTYVY